MFSSWGRIVVRLRWAILAAAVAVVAVGGAWGSGVFESLADGGFQNPDSPSAQADERIDELFGSQDADVVLLYSSDEHAVSEPEFADPVSETLDSVAGLDEVSSVTSYYNTESPQFVSEDGHSTIATVSLSGDSDEDRADQYDAISDELDAPGVTTQHGGWAAVFSDINTQTKEDMVSAEMIAMPLLLVLMVIIFGSLTAALTPLMIAVIAITGGLAVTRALTYVTDVSVFAVNVITIIGLGMAIDYSLFIVKRFREELAAGRDRREAVARTVATAGRTVTVSGLIIVFSLAGLLLFPLPFLHGIAYGGMAAVAIAMIGAVTVLPAVLYLLGRRVDSLSLPWRRKQRGVENGSKLWAKVGGSVMRRPALYLIGVLAVLAVIAGPLAKIAFGGVDERMLPAEAESRVVTESVDADFPGARTPDMTVLVEGGGAVASQEAAADIADIDNVDEVVPADAQSDDSLLGVYLDVAPDSPEARETVDAVRGLDAPPGSQLEVAGFAPEFDDMMADIVDNMPWLGLYVVAVTLLLLFLAFGSIVLPVKAVLMNVVSIAAAFGVVVWIFQDGNLSGPLDFTSMGALEPSSMVLVLVMLFGLSTDYEVFLLSRVREEWDHTGDNRASVLQGLQRTGGIITAAALLLIVVVGAFATSGILMMKMIGVGMAVAIFLDATVVRLLLVPSTMRLLGRANWWAPKPLRRFYASYGLKEGEDAPAPRENQLATAAK
ncbi:MAG: MMPL family transporter [Stackebrandtia sp.]